MDILFNSKFLNHNRGSYAEGPYRIQAFRSQVQEVDKNGEEYFSLVHNKTHIALVREACENQATTKKAQAYAVV